MTFNILSLPLGPYTTKMELKRGSKEYYDFKGVFKEIWFDLQVTSTFNNQHLVPVFLVLSNQTIAKKST